MLFNNNTWVKYFQMIFYQKFTGICCLFSIPGIMINLNIINPSSIIRFDTNNSKSKI